MKWGACGIDSYDIGFDPTPSNEFSVDMNQI